MVTMHPRPPGARSRHTPTYSGSIGQKAQLVNAYSEIGKELSSRDIKVIGNYTLGRTIGEGSFGNVKMAVHRLTGTRVAMKQIPKTSYSPHLTREIHHHRRLHHPFVVQLYEVIATESSIWLATELCAGGELFDYLVEKGRLTEVETRRLFGQICLGLGYIHRQGVVHRDLKLENVLLDERCNAKVADFGFGREFEPRRLMDTFCGTTAYVAPEILAGVKYSGEEVDVWSMGIILYTLLAGSLPFDDDDDDEDNIKRKIKSGVYTMPDFLTKEACDLIYNILQLDPKNRLSISQILGHAWFTIPPSLHQAQEPSRPTTIREEALIESPVLFLNDTPNIEDPRDAAVGLGILSESDLSEHSAADSDLGIGSGRSGASSPVTSEESPISSCGNSKHEGEVRCTALVLQHGNTSQTTIRKPDVDSRGKLMAPSLSTHDEGEVLEEHDRHAKASSSTLSVNASATLKPPCIQKSPAGYSPSSSMASSRTPSRTKRRSVGSTMSERLLPVDEIASAPFDYIAALNTPHPLPLNSEKDKNLLSSLTSIGFDVGQIVHSVRTNACDASGAMWWLIKKKADIAEANKEYAEMLQRRVRAASEGNGQSDDDRLERDAVLREKTSRSEGASPVTAKKDLFKFGGVASNDDATPTGSGPKVQIATSPTSDRQMDQTPNSAISYNSVTSGSTDYFDVGSIHSAETSKSTDPAESAGTLAAHTSSAVRYPVTPPTSRGSDTPTSAGDKKFADRKRSQSVSMLQRATFALAPSGSKNAKGKAREVDIEDVPDRPTSKKEGKNKEKDFRMLEDANKSGGNLPLVGLFSRRPSEGKALVQKVKELAEAFDERPSLSATVSSPSRVNPSIDAARRDSDPNTRKVSRGDQNTSPVAGPSFVNPRKVSTATEISDATTRASTAEDIAEQVVESNTSSTIVTQSKKTAAAPSHPSKTMLVRPKVNLFSSFRLWFNEDRRKRKRKMVSPGPQYTASIGNGTIAAVRPRQGSSSSMYRTDSGDMRIPVTRQASTGSRRSSTHSSRRVSLDLSGHPAIMNGPTSAKMRRRSDSDRASFSSMNGSRTPTSEPGSTSSRQRRSYDAGPTHGAHGRRRGHVRVGSTSSAGSRRSGGQVSPTQPYRRTPSGTTVRRLSSNTPGRTMRRSRSQSQASSLASDSEQEEAEGISGLSPNPYDVEETIEEEEDGEDGDGDRAENERARALRKLSGEGDQLRLGEFVSSLAPLESPASTVDTPKKSSAALVFAAHKNRNVFGAPSDSYFIRTSTSKSPLGKSGVETERPKLRDVFAVNRRQSEDGDWVDEDEDPLDHYSCGLGQSFSRSNSDAMTCINQSNPPPSPSLLLNEKKNASTGLLGEGRYAGIGRIGVGGSSGGGGIGSAGHSRERRGQQKAAGAPTFRGPAIVEEEEEDEA